MKVLLVGNGAREHAIAERLAEDCELYTVMSKKNPAISQLSKQHWVCDIENPSEITKAVEGIDFDLGFSSPDATLAAGVSDALAKAGISMASPSKDAARIEWDKGFMRKLMDEYKIPGAPKHKLVNSLEEAARIINNYGSVAIKPLGLTGGKGVRVSGDHFTNISETVHYAEELIKKDGLVLIEEKLVGEEFTLQAFCDGTRICFMPPVQDHKRAFTGDKGPNTGGMGAYSSGKLLPFMLESELEAAQNIMRSTIHAMKKNQTPFVGILYGQFILTANGIRLIEFNARFGDPEAMNVLALLKDQLSDIFLSMADGQLDNANFSDESTVVKYLVPEGYPTKPVKDVAVTIDTRSIESCGAKIYYASVYEKGGHILTTNSRSFGILGKSTTLANAEKIAEQGCKFVHGPVWHRSDIGTKKLTDSRVSHMAFLRDKS
ncbi:phosphoribosylamine--glycine ligase [Candidatus Micrarchaeota archaeon]|nr:phosphoribosylamine--glycine ligase [Candidatus Micrarchaeota archaeon]MBU1166141.1 phosphoribosylamine--glycine ligase [Candidatus Micrarchaeota archaeon]MBU1887316.1 phosphoribosylamine--glycine ligase [Candidatus Micrarchaeota archaeon]